MARSGAKRTDVKPEHRDKVQALAVEGCKVAGDEPGTLLYVTR